MRVIDAERIVDEVSRLCVECNYFIGDDVEKAFVLAKKTEKSPLAVQIIDDLILNAKIAEEKEMPICQDTGMAVVFVEIGQDVHITGRLLEEAIHEGVRRGYREGYLRKSVVGDPLLRNNTGDNTPAVIHYEIVAGETLKITLAAKGFGSENMSRMKLLKPAEGTSGVVDFILETVEIAGGNPCPPIVVGVGIGGTIEKAALIAKKALMRDIGVRNSLDHIAALETEVLEKINSLGIGPQGLGGSTTALGVNIETYPTHIAGLPVVVNINCHASRHLTVEL
jgi:fumarate hydratase subunit alpha